MPAEAYSWAAGLGEFYDAVFRRDPGAGGGKSNRAEDRCHVDDPPTAAIDHRGIWYRIP